MNKNEKQNSNKARISGYQLFSKELREKSSKKDKRISLSELSLLWKNLSYEEKGKFNDRALNINDKIIFNNKEIQCNPKKLKSELAFYFQTQADTSPLFRSQGLAMLKS